MLPGAAIDLRRLLAGFLPESQTRSRSLAITVQRAAGLDAERVVRDDGVAAVRRGRLVALLDQQPVLAPFTGGLAAHPHQCPVAVQFLAVQLRI